MRNLAAVAIASMLLTSVASAQMKVPQATPQAPSNPASPVVIQPAPPQSAEPTLESARRISRAEAIKMVKDSKAVFVDVRSKDSYDAGHIKGAINIPLSELMGRLRELPPRKFIITYCA
jgi:3-mercaptopyruvate sulfurtransferase SseA